MSFPHSLGPLRTWRGHKMISAKQSFVALQAGWLVKGPVCGPSELSLQLLQGLL